MSSSSSSLNSAFPAASFSLSSFRNLEAMGGPWVTTSWLTGGSRLEAHTTAGNSSSRRLEVSFMSAAAKAARSPAAETGLALAAPGQPAHMDFLILTETKAHPTALARIKLRHGMKIFNHSSHQQARKGVIIIAKPEHTIMESSLRESLEPGHIAAAVYEVNKS
jgi:hypothetical protein